MEQYDFSKFLKYYLYLFDIKNYNVNIDQLFFDKICTILNTSHGNTIFEIIVLPSSSGSTTFYNVYICYDKEKSSWDDIKILSNIKNIMNVLGVKL